MKKKTKAFPNKRYKAFDAICPNQGSAQNPAKPRLPIKQSRNC